LFSNKTNQEKLIDLKKFIAENKNKRYYKEEIGAARKLLRSIGE
jgi:hypothetical protein